MASGDTLAVFSPLNNEPPSTLYAWGNVRNSHPVLEFDAAADWFAIFSGLMPRHYSGNGLTVTLMWMAASATTNNCVWNAAFERMDDETTDLDADSFAAVQAATGAAPGTSGMVQYTAITFTNGAQMDSVAAGEAFRLRVSRDADNGSDNMTANAQLLMVEIKET